MKYNFYPFCRGENYKLVLVKGNKAVIKMETTYDRAPYNGYVVFPAKEIPKDWWGNYNAGALQYLDIHGGISFCGCCNNDVKVNKKHIDKTSKKLDEVKERSEDSKGYMDKFKKRQMIRLKANKELAKLNDSYIVFGFDCAHSGDDMDECLYHKEHIMLLVEKMEKQLMDYAGIYEKWKKMDRKSKLKP